MAKAKEARVTKGKRRAGQLVGYLRVSSLDQKELRQLDGMTLDKRFVDKASGKDLRQPELEQLTGYVREGDTVICQSTLLVEMFSRRIVGWLCIGAAAVLGFGCGYVAFDDDRTPGLSRSGSGALLLANLRRVQTDMLILLAMVGTGVVVVAIVVEGGV